MSQLTRINKTSNKTVQLAPASKKNAPATPTRKDKVYLPEKTTKTLAQSKNASSPPKKLDPIFSSEPTFTGCLKSFVTSRAGPEKAWLRFYGPEAVCVKEGTTIFAYGNDVPMKDRKPDEVANGDYSSLIGLVLMCFGTQNQSPLVFMSPTHVLVRAEDDALTIKNDNWNNSLLNSPSRPITIFNEPLVGFSDLMTWEKIDLKNKEQKARIIDPDFVLNSTFVITDVSEVMLANDEQHWGYYVKVVIRDETSELDGTIFHTTMKQVPGVPTQHDLATDDDQIETMTTFFKQNAWVCKLCKETYGDQHTVKFLAAFKKAEDESLAPTLLDMIGM